MMVEASLLAPVAAQPSLPFFQSGALDVEPEKLALASNRADAMSLLGLRFEDDFRCPAARFERLEASLQGTAGSTGSRFHSVVVPGEGHSTLRSITRKRLTGGSIRENWCSSICKRNCSDTRIVRSLTHPIIV